MPNPYRYYFPAHKKNEISDGQQINQDFLRDYGLGDSLADILIEPNDCHVFQIEGAGCLLTPGCKDGRVANVAPPLNALRRHEFKFEDGREVWLMWEGDQPPELSDLARVKQIGGYSITLDGFASELKVPVARSHEPTGATVPHSFVFDINSDGYSNFKSVIDRKFEGLWEMAKEYFDVLSGAAPKMSEARLLEIAMATIQVNYRIGKLEVASLQRSDRSLVNSLSVLRILTYLVDGPNFPSNEEIPEEQMTDEQKSIEQQKKTSPT